MAWRSGRTGQSTLRSPRGRVPPAEYVLDIAERRAGGVERDQGVVDEVRRFLRCALAIPVRARSHELRGLLAELLEAEVAITEEAHGVGLRVFGAGGIGSMAIVWSIRAISAAGGSFRGRIDAVGGRPLVLRRSSDA